MLWLRFFVPHSLRGNSDINKHNPKPESLFERELAFSLGFFFPPARIKLKKKCIATENILLFKVNFAHNTNTFPTNIASSLTFHSGMHCTCLHNMLCRMSLYCNPINIPGWTGPHERKPFKWLPDGLAKLTKKPFMELIQASFLNHYHNSSADVPSECPLTFGCLLLRGPCHFLWTINLNIRKRLLINCPRVN